MNSLISDAIQQIFSFLSQEEIFKIRTTCKAFNIKATSNQIMMPFLNRLKAIDNRVSVLPPKDISSETWCYERFIKEYWRIANSQATEIEYLLADQNLPQNDEIKVQIASLKTLQEHVDKYKIQLDTLEQRHDTLDRLNMCLILPKIDLNETKLNLCNSRITRIPENLFIDPKYENYWNKLQILNCSYNQLQTLPKFLGNCQMLKELYCNDNKLKSLPVSLVKCQALQKISCHDNQLQALPKLLGNCHALQELFCSNNKLKTLPDSLGNCKALQNLSCGYNQLKALPETLGHCEALLEINCSNNQLKTLPESLGCRNLKKLSCCNNQLKNLPETLAFRQLEELNCHDNELQTLPKSMSECQALEMLDCDNNQLQSLPESLGNCHNLQELRCYNNQIQALPTLYCQALRELHCSKNKLRALPESLDHCQELQTLYCSDNQLQVLPEKLGYCQALEELDCSNNNLQVLPESLGNCQSLEQLTCFGNNLTNISNAIKNKLGLDWYNDTIHQQKKPPISQNIKEKSNIMHELTIKADDNKPKITVNKTWLITAAVLISIGLISFVSHEFTFITAFLLKINMILPTITFAAISIATGLAASVALLGVYHLGIALKKMMIRYLQNPEQRCEADNKVYDQQLNQLMSAFSTSTTQSFVRSLNDIQSCVSHSQLIQYKQFEIAACKKIVNLKGEIRNQAKEAVLTEARQFLKY
ncbi:MAG: leucine-rich repeat domain-containing protein [Proteobacteria bacterium]|nr:leucine-rich repeat domain-containing protein [Pseudomonadota bacterium]